MAVHLILTLNDNLYYIKLNFDGYVIPHHQAAIGSVIRDSPNFGYITNCFFYVLTVEAIALRQGLQQAINQDFH